MRIAKLGVVGAGTMGSGIAALAASAGLPVVLLDIAGKDGDRNGPAKAGLERAKRARPAAFMDPARASLITIGDLTFAGKTLVQGQGHVTEVYSLLLVIYFVMALALGRLMQAAERRVPGAVAKEAAR